MDQDDFDFVAAIRQERLDAMRAGQTFVRACVAADLAALFAAVHAATNTVGGWPFAFRAVCRTVERPLPLEVRRAFLEVWVENKSIARNFDSHRPLLDGLRRLLPRYRGGPKRLYRGAFWRERCHRTYGLSWTTSRTIAADKFATDTRQYSTGGSCLLETVAPAAAIIGCVGDHYDEKEYLVDRRLLESVRVVKRFPQLQMPDRSSAIRRLGEGDAPGSG